MESTGATHWLDFVRVQVEDLLLLVSDYVHRRTRLAPDDADALREGERGFQGGQVPAGHKGMMAKSSRV